MADSKQIERHYGSAGIADRILAALRAELGEGAPVTPDALAPLDHFHGRGLQATRELVAVLAPRRGERLLDIGSGIGGPARWIAATFDCHVTGIDLTREFCQAAEALNEAAGLADRVRIVHGNALALPFEADSFDRAYSQNVLMNIEDKVAFYREACRVLRPGGVLAVSIAAAGPNGAPYFPVPWATTAATSFLSTPQRAREEPVEAGLEILSFKESASGHLAGQVALRRRIEAEGLPRLGIHTWMGERMQELQINSLRSLEDGRTTTIEILARKPG